MNRKAREAITLVSLALMVTVLFLGTAPSISRLWAYWIVARSNDIERATAIAPFDTRLLFIRSLGELYQKKDCEAVKKTLGRVLKLSPHYWDAANNLAICYAILDKPKEAERLWRGIIDEWPFYEVARKNLKEISKTVWRKG